jgi:hypothetical protein
MKHESITEQIDYFLRCFSQMTKEEADFVESIVKWDDQKRSAFKFAKRIFDEEEDVK